MDPAATVGLRTAQVAIKRMPWVIRNWSPCRRQWLGWQVRRLSAGSTFSSFVARLGEPVASRRTPEGLFRRLFLFPECCVWVIVDNDETVLAYTVTSLHKKFRPSLPRVFAHLTSASKSPKRKLSRFSFSDVGIPTEINAICGANRFGYSEIFYIGRPGWYQHFLLAVNFVGPHNLGEAEGDIEALAELDSLVQDRPLGHYENQADLRTTLSKSRIDLMRSRVQPNTYGVTCGDVSPGSIDLWFGPEVSEVAAIANH